MEILAQVGKFLDITLGNVITLCTFAGAFLMGWQRLRDQLSGLQERMEHVESTLQSMSEHGVPAMCSLHAKRLDSFEEKMQAVAAVATDIAWIKANLESIGARLDNERRHRA